MADLNRYARGEKRPVLLTDAELELVVIALAELTVERRRFATHARRTDPTAADNALTEVMGAGILGNRLSLEHMDRQKPPAAGGPLTCPHGNRIDDSDCPRCVADADELEGRP